MTLYYYKLVEFGFSVLFLVCLILFVCFLISPITNIREKNTAYECGFHPFDTARRKVDIHSYIVAILFIIFDLEFILLILWCIYFPIVTVYTFRIMFLFLFFLFIGFLVEWFEGALDW